MLSLSPKDLLLVARPILTIQLGLEPISVRNLFKPTAVSEGFNNAIL